MWRIQTTDSISRVSGRASIRNGANTYEVWMKHYLEIDENIKGELASYISLNHVFY